VLLEQMMEVRPCVEYIENFKEVKTTFVTHGKVKQVISV